MELNLTQNLILQLTAFIQGVAKAGIPGMGVLAVPLAAMVLPAKLSTGVLLPLLILGDTIGVGYWRRSADWRSLFRALPWALAGIVAGYFLMKYITNEQLRPVIGLIVLAMLAMHVIRDYFRKPLSAAAAAQAGSADETEAARTHREGSPLRRRSFAAFMGFTGGVTTMMANAAGPVMAIYLLALRLPKAAFIGTSAWFFLMVNWFKVPFSVNLHLIQADSLTLNLRMIPALLVGIVLGILVVKRLPEKTFSILVQVLSAVAALRLLWS